MHAVMEVVQGWQQSRRGVTPECRLTRGGCIVEDMAVLVREHRDHAHHRFHTSGALRAVGPNAARAPAHARTEGPVGQRVGRFHPGMAYDRPHGLPPVCPASRHRATSRRMGRMSWATRACASRPLSPRDGPTDRPAQLRHRRRRDDRPHRRELGPVLTLGRGLLPRPR